jgi:protein SCO1/2
MGYREWRLAPLAAILLLLASCIQPKPLAVLGQVAPFQLIDQAGQPFDGQSLAGHVWVADFIFTTCPGPCPMMSSQLHQVQTRTAESPDVKLVSFTVDPAHDTPSVLAEYSRHFQAERGRWWFLTGDQARLNDLGLNSFHLNTVDGSTTHSTRFVLVDRRMRIRGYYSTSEDDFMPRLLHDIRQLEREAS